MKRFLRVLGILALSSSAFASSFYEQPFPDTVRDAQAIVRGKILKSEARWGTLSDGTKQLFTVYDVDVSEGLKGSPKSGTPIQIREIGGVKGESSLQVSGTAGFSIGEDVVVMLGEASEKTENAYPLRGMMMGKFNLEKGEDGKEYLQGPGLGSSLHPGMRNEQSPAKKNIQVSLENLREIIRTQASEPAPSPTATVAAGNPSVSAVISAKDPDGTEKPIQVIDEGISRTETKRGESSLLRWIILVLGVGFGSIWFLNSRKKKG